MALDRIALAPLAEENGFAVMLFDLLRQNLDAKPHKLKDFDAITANVAIVVEDADVALTLCFGGGRLTIRNGIAGVPDATIRGDADSIIGMSNLPLSRRLGVPWAHPRDETSISALRGFVAAIRQGRVHTHTTFAAIPALARLTRIMSVHG
ncbi:MAG: hypothetical protein IPG50_05345 [Myxococcales bacterium]|nr:hypothetical protein [Myxococcales bacterium]